MSRMACTTRGTLIWRIQLIVRRLPSLLESKSIIRLWLYTRLGGECFFLLDEETSGDVTKDSGWEPGFHGFKTRNIEASYIWPPCVVSATLPWLANRGWPSFFKGIEIMAGISSLLGRICANQVANHKEISTTLALLPRTSLKFPRTKSAENLERKASDQVVVNVDTLAR